MRATYEDEESNIYLYAGKDSDLSNDEPGVTTKPPFPRSLSRISHLSSSPSTTIVHADPVLLTCRGTHDTSITPTSQSPCLLAKQTTKTQHTSSAYLVPSYTAHPKVRFHLCRCSMPKTTHVFGIAAEICALCVCMARFHVCSRESLESSMSCTTAMSIDRDVSATELWTSASGSGRGGKATR